mgnify:CR=1 FL=1
MSIDELFHSEPTRQLEEVQKVNARERAETDVREFHETESAERVLKMLGETIETHPSEAARFLYIHATFGSGKTHLLKLVGLLADDDSEFAFLGDRLAEKWPGFDELQQSISNSHVDRLKPVFLNLLDRDASKEPPLPFLIFEAIGRTLGYPTDPNWLLEWAWTVDMEYDGVWEALQAFEHNGKTFEEVLAERASLRSWLYEALPAMPETSGTTLDSSSGVKTSIETAEADVEPEVFVERQRRLVRRPRVTRHRLVVLERGGDEPLPVALAAAFGCDAQEEDVAVAADRREPHEVVPLEEEVIPRPAVGVDEERPALFEHPLLRPDPLL